MDKKAYDLAEEIETRWEEDREMWTGRHKVKLV